MIEIAIRKLAAVEGVGGGAFNGRYTFRTTDEQAAVEQLGAKLFGAGKAAIIVERNGAYRVQGTDRQIVALVK